MTVGQCIIFTNTRKFASTVDSHMRKNDRSCALLTGELRKEDRDSAVASFEKGQSKVLVTTNLIARG